jgi:hypothetical protein
VGPFGPGPRAVRAVSLKKGPKLVISIFHLFKIQFEKAHFFSRVSIS